MEPRRHETTIDGCTAWATQWQRNSGFVSGPFYKCEIVRENDEHPMGQAGAHIGDHLWWVDVNESQVKWAAVASAVALALAPEAARLASGTSVEDVMGGEGNA